MEFFRDNANGIVPLHPRTAGDCPSALLMLFSVPNSGANPYCSGFRILASSAEVCKWPLANFSQMCAVLCCSQSVSMGFPLFVYVALWSTYTLWKTRVDSFWVSCLVVGLTEALLQLCRSLTVSFQTHSDSPPPPPPPLCANIPVSPLRIGLSHVFLNPRKQI